MSKDTVPDLPIGVAVMDWKAPPIPLAAPLQGDYARVEPLDVATHSDSLFAAFAEDATEQGWTYMGYGRLLIKPSSMSGWWGAVWALIRCFSRSLSRVQILRSVWRVL